MAVLLAGGHGTRLWPLARAASPKQFLPLWKGKSLFRLTYERIAPVVGSSKVLVVAGAVHERSIRRQAPEIPPDNILVEALGRNTAASIAFAALVATQRWGDAVMVVLPSDHWIRPASRFRSVIRTAIGAAERFDGLVLLGVPPRSPDPGFGYIQAAGDGLKGQPSRIVRFIEKPATATARRLIRSGRCFWNSGIFVWRASTVLRELSRHRPGIVRPLQRFVEGGRGRVRRLPAAVLRRVPRAPIDRAVVEKSAHRVMLRAGFSWSDMGTFESLARLLAGHGSGNRALGDMLTLGASGCVGINPRGLTVMLGVRNLVAVRSNNVLLVCERSQAHRIRDVVDRLRGRLRRER